MPYPRGIKTPAIRAAWMAERHERVKAYDRLLCEGLPRYKAARAIGSDVSSIEAMRRSIEQLAEGGHAGRSGNSYIDLGLSLLTCLRKPGETLTAHDIAAWCGCSRAAIQTIEQRALRKVRQRLTEAATDQELAQELKEMLSRNGESL